MARPLFSSLLVLFLLSTVLAKPYPEIADQKERQALDQLALEIEGIILYSRPPDRDQGEKKWMLDTVKIGEWNAETLDEGLCGRWSN